MSLASANNSYKIDPLNGNNYSTWRRRLEWILDDLDLWDIMTGADAELVPVDLSNITMAERQVIANWQKKDKKVRKEICLRISDEHLVYIDQFMGSHAIWTRLQEILSLKEQLGPSTSAVTSSTPLPRTEPTWRNIFVNSEDLARN